MTSNRFEFSKQNPGFSISLGQNEAIVSYFSQMSAYRRLTVHVFIKESMEASSSQPDASLDIYTDSCGEPSFPSTQRRRTKRRRSEGSRVTSQSL